MSKRIHLLAQQIFGKSSVDECDLQEIKNLTTRYPYFAPAQFLLLEKLKRENAPDYTAQLQKAVLYYHNPLEFEYFISSERFETEIDFEESSEPLVINHQQDENFFETLSEESNNTNNIEEASTSIEEINIPEQVPEITLQEVIEEKPADEIANEATVPKTETDNIIEETPDDNKIAESIERVLEKEEEQTKEPVPDSNTDLVFEPYHTVDYFASQGIKLSQEEVPKDKFGRQLKSFTEWLKTMKRLPAKEISKNIDPASESNVQHLAEDSVHDADVVTEAMAEVWIKQGNREKALETYNKLSLLNPSKKAYFAALIENLKRS